MLEKLYKIHGEGYEYTITLDQDLNSIKILYYEDGNTNSLFFSKEEAESLVKAINDLLRW